MLINCQFFMFEFHLIVNFDIYNHSSLFLNINKHDFHLKKKKKNLRYLFHIFRHA